MNIFYVFFFVEYIIFLSLLFFCLCLVARRGQVVPASFALFGSAMLEIVFK